MMDAPAKLSRPLAQRTAALADAPPQNPGKPASEAAIEGAMQALDARKTHYTTRHGIAPLRDWVAERIAQDCKLTMPADDITITAGMQEAEFVALAMLTQPGTQVLFTDHDDNTVRDHLNLFAPLLNIEAVNALDDPAKISVLYIAGPDDRLQGWLTQANERGWWVIYSRWPHSTSLDLSPYASLWPRMVITGGLDADMEGWRIGWVAGSEKAMQLRAFKQSLTICAPSISQWAALSHVKDNA